ASSNVSMRTDQAMLPDRQRMLVCAAQYCVLHHDTVTPDLDGLAFSNNASSEHDSRTRADLHIAAHNRIGRDIRSGINERGLVVVRENHVNSRNQCFPGFRDRSFI